MSAQKLYEHPDFKALELAMYQVEYGARALIGLGNMMQPQKIDANEEIFAMREDVAMVLMFFGETLKTNIAVADNARQMVEHLCFVAEIDTPQQPL